MRTMYLSQLKALEVQDADDILPEVTDEMVSAFDQAQQPAQQPEKAPRDSISIPYKELLPSERAQALQRIGIQPAGAQENAGVPEDTADAPPAPVAGAKELTAASPALPDASALPTMTTEPPLEETIPHE
jgi:hypothetical protein